MELFPAEREHTVLVLSGGNSWGEGNQYAFTPPHPVGYAPLASLSPKGEGTLVQLYTLFTRFLNNRVALFLLSDWAVPTARESIALFYAYSAMPSVFTPA